MIVLGKAIANGAPLGLLGTRPEFLDLFSKARVGGTHSKELFGVYPESTEGRPWGQPLKKLEGAPLTPHFPDQPRGCVVIR